LTTLLNYRRHLAPLLGVYEYGSTTSSSVNNTTTQLESTAASQNNGVRFKSSVNSAGLFKDKHLHRYNAAAPNDKDRLIASYTPTSGFFTPDDAWTNAPISEAFEIMGLFSGTEIEALFNLGLKRCLLVVDFTFTVASATARKHSLATAAPWLSDPRQVYQVGQLVTGQDPLVYDPFAAHRIGRVTKDGATVYLEGLSFNTTDTVYVKAIKPAYYHCKPTGGAYGDQSALVLETDEAPVDPDWLAWATVLAGKDRIDAAIEGGSAEDTRTARESRAVAAARFTQFTRENFQPPERTFTPRVWLGPTLAASW
jgi:hypothetical protein